MCEQELFISTLTKFNPKKSSSGELRKGSRKIYRGGLLQRGFYSFYLKTFVGLTLFYERISVSFLMMDFLSHVTYHAHFLLACEQALFTG